jgi:hypothetical protein
MQKLKWCCGGAADVAERRVPQAETKSLVHSTLSSRNLQWTHDSPSTLIGPRVGRRACDEGDALRDSVSSTAGYVRALTAAAIKHPTRTSQPDQDAAQATISTGGEKGGATSEDAIPRVGRGFGGPHTGGNTTWQYSVRNKQAGGSRGQRCSNGGDPLGDATVEGARSTAPHRTLAQRIRELESRLENGGCRVGEPSVFRWSWCPKFRKVHGMLHARPK